MTLEIPDYLCYQLKWLGRINISFHYVNKHKYAFNPPPSPLPSPFLSQSSALFSPPFHLRLSFTTLLLQSFPFFPLRLSYTTLHFSNPFLSFLSAFLILRCFPNPFLSFLSAFLILRCFSNPFPSFLHPFPHFVLLSRPLPRFYFRSTHPPSNPSSLLSHYFTFSFLSLILLVHTLPPPVSLNGDGLFGVPSRFSLLYNLSVYCTACLRCFKVGPVLEINRDLHFSTLLLTFPLSISLFLFYIFLSPLPSFFPFSSTPSLLFFLSLPPPVSFTFLSPTHSYAPPLLSQPPIFSSTYFFAPLAKQLSWLRRYLPKINVF